MFSSTEHYQAFKRQLGHTNHDLVTILIGLDAVKNGIAKKPEQFPSKWDPIDLKDSSRRARRFARSATLAWAVDCLDFYLYRIAKESFYLIRPVEFDDISNIRSVYRRLDIFRDVLGLAVDLPLSLTHLMIQWRNNLLHSAAENNLESAYAGKLRNATAEELERFRHLDCSRMLDNFKKCEPPTLKEVAGGIQSINLVTGAIDQLILKRVDVRAYAERRLRQQLGGRKDTIQKIWGNRDSDSKCRSLGLVLSAAGIVESQESGFIMFRDELKALSVQEALAKYALFVGSNT